MLSLTLSSMYIQMLLDRLQVLRIGCYIGGTFVGTKSWADNFLFTKLTHTAMQTMLDTVSSFAKQFGLEFSTNTDSVK